MRTFCKAIWRRVELPVQVALIIPGLLFLLCFMIIWSIVLGMDWLWCAIRHKPFDIPATLEVLAGNRSDDLDD